MHRNSKRERRGNITEFSLIFTVLLPLVVFPLMNLSGLALAATTALLAAHQAATSAAVQQTYPQALSSMNAEMTGFYNSGFASLTKMGPIGGYSSSGANLYIVATNFRSPGQSVVSQQNAPIGGAIDPTTYIYECRVDLSVKVDPLVDLQSVPFIGKVAGVGKPALLNFSVSRVAEHPNGLTTTGVAASSAIASGAPVGSVGYSLDNAMPRLPSQSGWNYPNIYDSINESGQTPVDEDVLIVDSKNPGWTESRFQLDPSKSVWIDYQADGMWKAPEQPNFALADGYSSEVCPDGFPKLCMIAQVGNNKPFYVGSQKTFVPQGNGTLYVAANSGNGPIMGADRLTVDPDYFGNKGAMLVRIVIASPGSSPSP